MADPQPGTERPYQVDDAWSRAVFARRTGAGAAFSSGICALGCASSTVGAGPAQSPSTSPRR